MELKQMIRRCLIAATMGTSGKKIEDITPEMVNAWLAWAEDNRLSTTDFLEAFKQASSSSDFFPTWARVLKAHCYIKGSRLTDPVIVGDHDGVLELGERAACDALGTSYRELGAQEGPQALPMTTTDRTAVKERLSESLAKAESKLLGKPEPKVKAEYVEDDDPAQQAKHQERVQAIEAEQEQIAEARNEA